MSPCLSLYTELVNTVDGAIRFDRFHRETKNTTAPTISARATNPEIFPLVTCCLIVRYSPPTTPPTMTPASALMRTRAPMVLEANTDVSVDPVKMMLGELLVDCGAPKRK